jgi:uncharacterized surface protein with fasciclin (FAS1) repeats
MLEYHVIENKIKAARMFNMEEISHTVMQHTENITI